MGSIQREAITGVNETIKTIKGAQDQCPEQEQLFSLVTFSDPMGDEIPQADLIIEILKSEDELTRTASLISSNLALREALERQFSHVE